MVSQDNDNSEQSYSLSKWASCPELDDIGQKEDMTTSMKTRSITMPEFSYMPTEPNMDSKERNTSTSSDSDNAESYPYRAEGCEGLLSADKPFRRRTLNITSSHEDLPLLMKNFRLRKKNQVKVKPAGKKG